MSDKPICLFCGEKQIMVSSERRGRGNSSYLMASASCGCCYAIGPVVQSDHLQARKRVPAELKVAIEKQAIDVFTKPNPVEFNKTIPFWRKK